MSGNKGKSRIKTRELTELAILSVLIFVGKEMMNAVPNVHPVMPLIIFGVITYGFRAIYPIIIFIVLEISLYGLGVWSISYLYIWPIFFLICMLFRRNRNYIVWALIAGLYGLAFGALSEIPFVILNGFATAFAAWISGIPFDLVHGASAFALTLVLVPVLVKLYSKLPTTP